jgi:hypothetical protein
MIIVVEGPSAAGKTTWTKRHSPRSRVPESPRPDTSPSDPEEAARFWAAEGARRWSEALRIEREIGIAVCDTDPLKLHYAWCLWRLGVDDEAVFQLQATAYREMVSLGRLGFADVFLVSVPDPAMLAYRKSIDEARSRRNFDLHRRLAEPLREWYRLIEEFRSGSVRWSFPEGGVDDVGQVAPREPRSDLLAFDALVEAASLVARLERQL